MGLPEIVDFARNISVMVRVQGPDPKGLKMRKHAFHQYHFGKTTLSASGMLLPDYLFDPALAKQIIGDTDISLPDCTFVLTVASVIEPFLSLQNRDNSTQQAKNALITGSQIDVMIEGKMRTRHDDGLLDTDAPRWLSASLLTLVDLPEASVAVQSLIESSTGASDHGWEVGWSLSSHSSGPQNTLQEHVHQSSINSNRSMVREGLSNPSIMGKSTTRIAILGVASALAKDSLKLSISVANNRGDLLLAMGSPFGVLSPVHFFNSISVGSIANCYPAAASKRTLLMADIRCLPGMEGGPVFDENAQLIGILTRPLRQRTSGAEIQLLIPWEAIATSCSNLLQEEPRYWWKCNQANNENSDVLEKKSPINSVDHDISFNNIHEKPDPRCSFPSPVEKTMASICLITIDDGAWASGILLNKQGLVLTNAHLLEPSRFKKAAAGEKIKTKSEVIFMPSNSVSPENETFDTHAKKLELVSTRVMSVDLSVSDERGGYKTNMVNTWHKSIRVRLDNKDPWIWVDARVLYISKGPLDVALLQLDYVPEHLCPISVDFTCPSTGSKACVVGHGLFGPRRGFFPSACIGVVSKIVKARRPLSNESGDQQNGCGHFPAMIETTAAVHPGGSGGAVVNSDGNMIGLVTSNARHAGGVLIPHLNFSIPCAALEPIFKFSKADMQDLSLLEDLDKPNEYISSIWALVPPLSPKPGPILPSPPEILQGDNTKEVKGSRFAKFIAERHELQKKISESGKVDSSTKFVPSKL